MLLPRLRAADPQVAVLADGFSCRTQIHELDGGGHEGVHLAELLAGGPASRPAPPPWWVRAALLAGTAGVSALAVGALRRREATCRRPDRLTCHGQPLCTISRPRAAAARALRDALVHVEAVEDSGDLEKADDPRMGGRACKARTCAESGA